MDIVGSAGERSSCAGRCGAVTSPVFFLESGKILTLVTRDDIEPGMLAKGAQGRLVIGEGRLESRGKATQMCALALLLSGASHY